MEMRSATRRCFASCDDPRRGLHCCCCFRRHIGLKLLPIIIIPNFFLRLLRLLLLTRPSTAASDDSRARLRPLRSCHLQPRRNHQIDRQNRSIPALCRSPTGVCVWTLDFLVGRRGRWAGAWCRRDPYAWWAVDPLFHLMTTIETELQMNQLSLFDK